MTIVCGTDFSKESDKAVEVAALLSSASGDPLRVVHVLDELGELEPHGEDRSVHDPKRALLREAGTLARRRGAEAEVLLTSGEVAPSLVRVASGNGRSLVVVAWLGRRPPSRWLVGHVAERLVCRSAVDTLVVRDSAPFRAWLAGERPLRVTLAVDLATRSGALVGFIAALRQLGPCEVNAVYVAWPPAEHRRLGINGPMDLEKLEPEVELALKRELEQKLGGPAKDSHVELAICQSFGRVDHRLAVYADEKKADLVVIGGRRRSWTERLWHRSVAKGILNLTHTNVASVVEDDSGRPASAMCPTVHQVLVATDFSDAGNRAIDRACSLLPDGGRMHLVHVVAPSRIRPAEALLGPSRDALAGEERLVGALRGRLAQLVPPVLAQLDISVTTHVLSGDVAEEVCGLARRLGVDVICVGSQGKSELAATLLGSVTHAILAASPKPVLVVPAADR